MTNTDRRFIHQLVVAGIACFFAIAIAYTLAPEPEYDAAGAARRPLVMISGQTQQIPLADYVSTVGGLSTNATAAAAGDIQTTTLATGALNRGVITATISGAQNDWNPTGLQTASVIAINVSTQTNLTGITAPTGNVSGRHLCLNNTGASTLSLPHESASSTAANRFILSGQATWQMPGVSAGQASQSLCFYYDTTLSRWVQIGSNWYLPKITAGSSGQFAVATTGAITGSTASMTGFGNVQAATASVLGIVSTTTFTTDVTPMSSYGVNSVVSTTRASGTAPLTNVGGHFSATGAQVNNALVADAGDVLLNKTSGTVGIGATPQIISSIAPTSVNHGSLGTGSTNWVGNVTGVGAFTSVTLTFSTAFANRSWCFAQPNATGQVIYVTNSASAPVFNCTDMAGVAANCVDFSYHCVGQ